MVVVSKSQLLTTGPELIKDPDSSLNTHIDTSVDTSAETPVASLKDTFSSMNSVSMIYSLLNQQILCMKLIILLLGFILLSNILTKKN